MMGNSREKFLAFLFRFDGIDCNCGARHTVRADATGTEVVCLAAVQWAACVNALTERVANCD